MFKEIEIQTTKGAVTIRIQTKGLIYAAYTGKLSEKNSSTPVMRFDGDNITSNDDEYYLPLPVEANLGRVLRLITEFRGVGSNAKNFNISITVKQGGVIVGTIEDSGEITGLTQSSLLLLKFI